MSEFDVKICYMRNFANEAKEIAEQLGKLQKEIEIIHRNMGFEASACTNIESRLSRIEGYVDIEKKIMNSYRIGIEDVLAQYKNSEQIICNMVTGNSASDKSIENTGVVTERGNVFLNEFSQNYGWKEILKGAGYFGTVYDLVQDINKGKTWTDFARTGVKVGQFVLSAARTFNKYKKIGRAVGTKTAMAWWGKKITGLKPLGRVSIAKNPLTRFKNNLTNKTSPFSAQIKNVVKDFKGANGVGRAVASWANVAVTGVTNWFANKEEQAASNGKMSDARVIAETITETVVDTALVYGAGIVAGAAVSALLPVAAPGIVVVAASGALVAGINAGIKALTGKPVTEWVSDGILDIGKAIGKGVSNMAKKASKAVGKWFKKLSFA